MCNTGCWYLYQHNLTNVIMCLTWMSILIHVLFTTNYNVILTCFRNSRLLFPTHPVELSLYWVGALCSQASRIFLYDRSAGQWTIVQCNREEGERKLKSFVSMMSLQFAARQNTNRQDRQSLYMMKTTRQKIIWTEKKKNYSNHARALIYEWMT